MTVNFQLLCGKTVNNSKTIPGLDMKYVLYDGIVGPKNFVSLKKNFEQNVGWVTKRRESKR